MRFEGVLCFVSETAAKTFVPLYLISDGEKHFYTTDRNEFGRVPKRYTKDICCYISAKKWKSFIPLFRLSKPSSGGDGKRNRKLTGCHVLTASVRERKIYIEDKGFQDDGIIGYVRKTGKSGYIPLYRALRKDNDSYFYTSEINKIDELIAPITNSKAEKILRTELKRYQYRARIYLADDWYFCPSLDRARKVVRQSKVTRRRYVYEKHDCDDFALLLKGEFIRDAYKDGNRRYPHASGIVWGNLPPHAMNVAIIDRWKGEVSERVKDRYAVYIIEPQNGYFYRPEEGKLDEIFLIVM